MDLEDLSIVKIHSSYTIKPFDCEDEDLNDFLFNKAIEFHKELLATTFVLEDESSTIAYYSVFNDSLLVEQRNFATKSAFNRFLKIVSHPKRHLKYFPALKIGRLAVNKTLKGQGVGRIIVNSIISDVLDLNERYGCKLLTVDAYSQSLDFYSKLGFEFLSPNDEGDDTRQMYFDLTPLTQ